MTRKLKAFVCEYCGKDYQRRELQSKFCSQKCKGLGSSLDAYKRRIEQEESRIPRADNLPEFHQNDLLVFSDPHSPRHCAKWLNYMCDVANQLGIRDGCCVGDLWDWTELTDFLRFAPRITPMESLKSGVEVAMAIAGQLKGTLYILAANHDIRPIKAFTKGKIDDPAEFYLEMIHKFLSSDKVDFKLHTNAMLRPTNGLTPYLLCHPDTYSQVSPQVERRLASKYHCHVLGAHGHQYAVGLDRSGKFFCVQLGHASQEEKHEYLHEKITTHPRWMRGFVIIKDGLLYPPFMDHPQWKNICAKS